MKMNKKTLKLFSSFFLLSAICYLSCEQPFKAGLGPIIDLQNPTIILDSPKIGASVRSIAEFTGKAHDDTELKSAWFQISSHPNVDLPGYAKMDYKNYGTFYQITNKSGDIRDWKWSFTINTLLTDENGKRVFRDGTNLMIKLLAIDSAAKDNYPFDEYPFLIKNDKPYIRMTEPLVGEGTADGELGGDSLNYNFYRPFPRYKDTESVMLGTISDNEGIYIGAKGTAEVVDDKGVKKTVELFPPQIRFWEVYFDDLPPYDSENPYQGHQYRFDHFPTLIEEPWRDLTDEATWKGLGIDGVKYSMNDLNNATFQYPLWKKEGKYYGFEIRAQSVDKLHTVITYPWDRDDEDLDAYPPETENKYVLIAVRKPDQAPILELYGLEDIYGPNWSPAITTEGTKYIKYERLPGITDQMAEDGNHPYVDKPIVYKGGPFTLRMKASHPEGIDYTIVYWEKEDKSARGRFIWDRADEPQSPNGWVGGYVGIDKPYDTWGRNEVDGTTNGNYMVRSFVFTYHNDKAKDLVPTGANCLFPGRSSVQRYKGSKPFDELEDDRFKFKDDKDKDENNNPDKWEPMASLTQGTYYLSVYTRSISGTRVLSPFPVTVYIDWTPPEIGLNDIEGKASPIDENYETPVIVNGVIRPKFRLSESNPWDTRFRTGSTSYFESSPGTYYSEQAYILVAEADKSYIDAYLEEKKGWPEFPTSPGAVWEPTITAGAVSKTVKIHKHGPIIKSACMFRTSHIYNDNSDPDHLEDGEYRLYAFARDNAFNVGTLSFPTEVRRSSDYPTVDFSVGIIDTNVTEPDFKYDWGQDAAKDPLTSFIITDNKVRNRFPAGSIIQVKITDDDSLDLGDDTGETSNIIVKFAGSKPNATGDIEVRDEVEFYAAFPVQSTYTDPDTGKVLRIPIKEITGTISETALLDSLKKESKYDDIFVGGREAYSSLPDGLYRVGITVQDYQPAKLKMEAPYGTADTKDADVVTVNIEGEVISTPLGNAPVKYFWIAVDSKNPEITITFKDEALPPNIPSTVKPGETTPSGRIISPDTPAPLTGFVADENGPITLANWRVLDGSTPVSKKGDTVAPNSGIPRIVITQDATYGDFTSRTYHAGKWFYTFEYQMEMNGKKDGTYNFELTFKDRFGNTSVKLLTYSVDNEPPKVTLTKLIETFSRPFDDVILAPSGTDYPQNPNDAALNKERLAVKTVNFSINVVDNFGVKGVRWWLLPWNVSASKNVSGFTSGTAPGEVLDYDAFPSAVQGPPVDYRPPGTYYPANGGAYGVVDVVNRQFTIAIDTTKMSGGPDAEGRSGNGQYRLHIIAVDDAGNYSRVTENALKEPTSNFFQEVFFLHEEDRPYFGTDDNITPGVVVTGAAWPNVDMDVRGDANPTIRGTIFENNGFSGTPTFWGGSITIWFSDTDADAAKALPSNWETLVASGTSIPGYTKKQIPNDLDAGIGRSGRNISLAIELAKLFPDAFKTDGKKRYIIKATDSPVNKLKYEKTVASDAYPSGIPMGEGKTAGDDEGVRVSRWRQFAFVYDAIPPVVEIIKPEKDGENKFSDKNIDTKFILTATIEDMNIATIDGKYYFEYYLDSKASERKQFILGTQDNPESGVTVKYLEPYPLPANTLPTKIEFTIASATVASIIIPDFKKDSFAEGQHTLNIFAWDKSGKEGAAWVSFTKDMKPPTITFANLTGDSRYYNQSTITNPSKVDKMQWWQSGYAATRENLLLGTNGATKLPLTTLSYDTGVPQLRGTITDLVSNIKLSTDYDSDVGTGDVNISPSAFKYWIDNESTERYPALIDGKGSRSVRWTINLTNNGKSTGSTPPIPLYDGVHTIVLTAADEADQEIPPEERYMIAFRVDSKQPKAQIVEFSGPLADKSVFGDVAYQPQNPFTIKVQGEDANLDRVELTIKDPLGDTVVTVPKNQNWTSPEWTYTPGSMTTNPPTDDKIVFTGSYDVDKSVFTTSGKYEIIVVSYDTANNKSEEAVRTFTYDNSKPEIKFTSPDDATKYDRTKADLKPENLIDDPKKTDFDPSKIDFTIDGATVTINRLTTSDKIQGNVSDEFSAIRQVQSQVWRWNWNYSTTSGWEIIEPWKDIPNLNLAANTQTQIAWTKNLMGQNSGDLDLNTVAGATTAEGLYRIQIRAKDASETADGTTPTGPDYEWNYTSDMGNPVISDYVYFYIDRKSPEMKITKINGADTSMALYYSNPGDFTFEGTVTDNNRFAKVEVKFESVLGTITIPPKNADLNGNTTPNLNQGPSTQTWKAVFPNANNNSFPDGRYKVTITVYDMTGKSYKEERAFTLDSTKPWAKFTLPTKVVNKGYGDDSENPRTSATAPGFASVIVQGGELSVITGETGDKPGPNGEQGSESGVDQMWFRLGYVGSSTAFPTKADITADETSLINDAKGQPVNAGKTDNQVLDYVADANGNSWFKLGSSVKPTYFKIDNPNIYDWRMEIPAKDGVNQIGGLKAYCLPIEVKGTQYNASNQNFYMVRPVTGEAGVYRLPLWIRLTDRAGNVEYYCHDIWIYPDGDIPSTTIESPNNGNKGDARGGTISVDGVAKSNTSVYDVIFRVFADDVSSTDLDGTKVIGPAPAKPGDSGYNVTLYNATTNPQGNLIRVAGYNTAEASAVNLLPTAYQNTQWQRANLTLPGGSGEPLIPWSIMLNSEDSIKNLIPAKGFNAANPPGTASNRDTIRVWLEVFVFSGEGSPARNSIYPDDLKGTANGDLYGTSVTGGGKPYVRAFFINQNAPQITHPNVGTYNVGTTPPWTWNTESPNQFGETYYGYKGAGTETRRDKFAFRAILDPTPTGGSGGLGEVAYRVKLDGGAYGTWTVLWKTGDPALPYNSNGLTISTHTEGGTPALSPARTRYDFIYAVDSRTSTSGFAAIPGVNWADSGGTITVQVRMKDRATPPNEAEQTIQVSVDNFAPVADTGYKTNNKVAGTNVDFMGRAYDYANPVLPASPPTTYPDSMTTDYTPRRLASVYAWFTKGTGADLRYVNMSNGDLAASLTSPRSILATTANSRTALIDGGGVNDAVKNITITSRGTEAAISYPSDANFVRNISESTATPGTKMLWSPVNSAVWDVRWSFTLDSTLLPDGKITLHYIIVDTAGNASYYTQDDITVKNKYPEINKVTLYTYNFGIGAAYTAPDQVEYNVNDYRSKMFANYMDPADYAKANSTGYLNSGFISKNNYIGFKVETQKGNRPLNYRLQHVTRERMPLTRTNLENFVTAMNSSGNINLYTIAWHGDYSSANWKALGVHEDNPTLGTHFVFQPALDKDGKLPADFKVSDTAEVWQYTATVSKPLASATPNYLTPTGAANQEDSTADVVLGPTKDDPGGADFNFMDTEFSTIAEKNGSHPDADDTSGQDNPTATDDKGTAFFLIRVWDSVGGTANTEALINDKLHDAIVIGMNIHKTDNVSPVSRLYDLNPYTETAVTENNLNATIRDAANPIAIGSNIVRGGLYNAGSTRAMVRSGFIDPRPGSAYSSALNPKNGLYDNSTPKQLVSGVPLPDYPLKVAGDAATSTVDQVSGRIILRGLAWDDQLIYRIQVKVNSVTRTILELDTTGNATTNPNYGKLMPTGDGQNRAFVVETLNWKTGHTAEWAYVWDTAENPINDAPATGVTVTAIVVDYKGNGGTPPGRPSADITADSATAFHNQVTVNVVPYITGFERETPKFATKRSLQGWYSFYQGESNIKVKGYNFGTGAAATTTGTVINAPTGSLTKERTLSIPVSGTSGAIEITFSGTAAYNNTSSTTGKSWNREYNSYTPGSDLWMNKPYAHIWRTTQSDDAPRTYIGKTSGEGSSNGLDYPGMALEYSAGGSPGTLHGTWAVYGEANSAYGTNDNSGNLLYDATPGEPYSTPAISIFQGGGASAANIALAHTTDGRPRLVIRSTVSKTSDKDTPAANTQIFGGSDGATERWLNIRLSKARANVGTSDNNVGLIYMTAFDGDKKGLWYGSRNGTANTTMYIDGTRDTAVAQNITATGSAATASANAGEFSAVDYDDTGPIIAYYDQSNDTVRVALGTSETPSTSQWQRRYLLPASHALYRGSGQHISIKVDRLNGIHLAFYNSARTTVVYYYASGRNSIGNAPDGTTVKVHTIDNVVTGGIRTDISVRDSGGTILPVIVYGDSSRIENYDGVRIAYKSGTGTGRQFTGKLACPVTGADITGWEAITMPADYTVKNDRLNIEAWPPTYRQNGASVGTRKSSDTWDAAIGYAGTYTSPSDESVDMFRVGYFFYPK